MDNATMLPEDVVRKNLRRIELPLLQGKIMSFAQSLLLTETGGALWDCAVVLNAYLEKHCVVNELTLFELGGGIGTYTSFFDIALLSFNPGYSACFAADMGNALICLPFFVLKIVSEQERRRFW